MQVRLMGKLYLQATSVLIHLGDAANDSDLAMRILAEEDLTAATRREFDLLEDFSSTLAVSSIYRKWARSSNANMSSFL